MVWYCMVLYCIVHVILQSAIHRKMKFLLVAKECIEAMNESCEDFGSHDIIIYVSAAIEQVAHLELLSAILLGRWTVALNKCPDVLHVCLSIALQCQEVARKLLIL